MEAATNFGIKCHRNDFEADDPEISSASDTLSSQIAVATVENPLGQVRYKALAGARAPGKQACGRS